ncbi:dirigent protein 21-like protein [Carex littledalei]|uniref:Dirigent protein n=1 Tax=Carex littledalei TaxID=544730 RepID=A0A833QKY9_9POAL|nr:dirigent protein 21-like protein [Carex littledalei]
MASPFLHLLLLSLSSISLLKISADTTTDSSSNTTHLHFFIHDTQSGSNPTAVQVTTGPTKLKGSTGPGFGSMFMIDDPLTESPDITSNTVGRAQGFYAHAGLSGTELLLSANIVLTGGDYNGSTITVFGRDNYADSVRELPVIGGSGKFRMARGYMLIKTNSSNLATADAVLDVDLYVSNGENGVVDESVPPSGGSTSTGGATSKTTGASSNGSILLCPNYVAILVMSCFLAKHLIFGI